MPGFELTSTPDRSWIALSRDLVATAAVPLDLSVDRLTDLLVLTTHLLTETLDSSADNQVKVSVQVDMQHLNFELSASGHNEPVSAVSKVTLDALADRHWTDLAGADVVVGFSFSA